MFPLLIFKSFFLPVVEGRRNRKPSRKILEQLAATGGLPGLAAAGGRAGPASSGRPKPAASPVKRTGRREETDHKEEDPLYKSVQVIRTKEVAMQQGCGSMSFYIDLDLSFHFNGSGT